MAEEQQVWVKLIATALLSVAVASGGAVVVSWRDLGVLQSDVGVLDRQLDAIATEIRQLDNTLGIVARQSAENSVHRIEHEKSADRWINQILANEAHLHELMKVPTKRPDPFTGTEGRQLEQRIRELEQRP